MENTTIFARFWNWLRWRKRTVCYLRPSAFIELRGGVVLQVDFRREPASQEMGVKEPLMMVFYKKQWRSVAADGGVTKDPHRDDDIKCWWPCRTAWTMYGTAPQDFVALISEAEKIAGKGVTA